MRRAILLIPFSFVIIVLFLATMAGAFGLGGFVLTVLLLALLVT